MDFKVTKFNGRKDNNAGQLRELSWHHFVHFLKQRRVHPYKWGESEQNENAPLFSPVEYASSLEGFTFVRDLTSVSQRTKEQYVSGKVYKNAAGVERFTDKNDKILRRNQNVVAVYMGVFDFDSHPADDKKPEIIVRPQDVIAKIEGHNYAIYSSFQSTAQYPRFRLVLPFDKPLTLEQFKGSWPFGIEQHDESCKDLARMFLMPGCPPEREAEAFFYAETEKKYFAPKLTVAKEKKKKKVPRGDYETLDAVTWFKVHGMEPTQVAPFKYLVKCPWASTHTNAHEGGTDTVLWVERGPGKWPTFSCSHDSCKRPGRDLQAVMELWKDQDEYCERALAPEKINTAAKIKALGHDDLGKYYYQGSQTNKIVPLKAREHQEREFYQITHDYQYWMKFYGDAESGKIDWKKAARDLMGQCHGRGFFRPEKVRGGGVWRDDGRLVAHLGRSLLVDGEQVPVFDFRSEYVYEAMVKEVDLPEALSRESMRKVYDLMQQLPFKANGHNALYAGMIVCGYLSGVLSWRPHLWITGEQGSGKTQIVEYTLSRLWRPMGGIAVEGVSTEAGLRQVEIRHNAVPVIVDEGESNDRREIDRVASIVRLARSSSSDSSANVVKGNSAATGHTYTVRCCFVLLSIVENLEHEQDKERFSVLELVKSEASRDRWPALRADLDNTFTKEFALGLYARVIELAPVIRANAVTFCQALIRGLPKVEPRWCDQYGNLLGAAWTLMTGETATHEQAWAYFKSLQGILELAEKSTTSIPKKALGALLGHIPTGQSKSLGELAMIVQMGTSIGWEDSQAAILVLARYGLKVEKDALFVSSNHPQAERILKDAGFPGHYNLLARIEGATKNHTVRFGHHSSKAVRIPLPKFEDERNVTNGHKPAGSVSPNPTGTPVGSDGDPLPF